MTIEYALALMALSAPITAAIIKLTPKRHAHSSVIVELAMLKATVAHIATDILEIKQSIRDIRSVLGQEI